MILNFVTPVRTRPAAPKAALTLRAAGDKARDRRQWGEAARCYR